MTNAVDLINTSDEVDFEKVTAKLVFINNNF